EGCARGCSTHKRPSGSFSNAAQAARVLPAHQPLELLKPEIPAEGLLPGGFFNYPKTKFVRVIDTKPGTGGQKITAMMPHWGPVPPGAGKNAYVDAVNRALGVRVNPSVQVGMTYADKLSAILSARDVPDLLSMPFWEVDKITRFSLAVKALFADLTDYLKGEAVLEYPMLATLPTQAWAHCVWGGRLAAVPFPRTGPFPFALFYRKDVF